MTYIDTPEKAENNKFRNLIFTNIKIINYIKEKLIKKSRTIVRL